LALPENLRKPDAQAALASHLEDLEQLVMSAAGYDKKRGDNFKIVALDMPSIPLEKGVVESGSTLMAFMPTAFNAALMLIVTLLVLFFGVRPLVKVIAMPPQLASTTQSQPHGALRVEQETPSLIAGPSGQPAMVDEAPRPHVASLIEARDRLKKVLQEDEESAVAIMKEWLAQERAA
jgi:flagellar M-ring protein FliF